MKNLPLQSFVHCKKRFDMDVDMEGSLNGRCIACSVVSNTPSNMLRHITGNGNFFQIFEIFSIKFREYLLNLNCAPFKNFDSCRLALHCIALHGTEDVYKFDSLISSVKVI